MYPESDSNSNDSYKIPKGTEIEVVQPLTISAETQKIPIIVYDNNQKKEVFVRKYDLYNKTSSNSDSIFLKFYKNIGYIAENIMNSKRYIIITLIVSTLLILGDSVLDSICQSFIRIDNYVSMFSLVLPGVIYLLINFVLAMINEEKYTQLLCDGLVLLPKDDMFISWTMYLSTIIFLIIIFKSICKLYLNYNPIIAILKFATAFILTFIFLIASIYAIAYVIGIIIVLVIFEVAASTHTVVIER